MCQKTSETVNAVLDLNKWQSAINNAQCVDIIKHFICFNESITDKKEPKSSQMAAVVKVFPAV